MAQHSGSFVQAAPGPERPPPGLRAVRAGGPRNLHKHPQHRACHREPGSRRTAAAVLQVLRRTELAPLSILSSTSESNGLPPSASPAPAGVPVQQASRPATQPWRSPELTCASHRGGRAANRSGSPRLRPALWSRLPRSVSPGRVSHPAVDFGRLEHEAGTKLHAKPAAAHASRQFRAWVQMCSIGYTDVGLDPLRPVCQLMQLPQGCHRDAAHVRVLISPGLELALTVAA